ncbi:MAG: hypothetical protein E7552_01315 [Ruminococcaceae bacterium]|nr:hypothetical protein [Oscillospiraceae bacterium]
MRESKTNGRARGWWQIFFDTFLVRNIVLVKLLGLCPIVVAAVNLKAGVTLTVCVALALLPTAFLMSLVGEKLKPVIRVPLYTLIALGILLGAGYVLGTYIDAELYASLYLFLPLLAVNSLMTYRVGGFAVVSRPSEAMADALGSVFGFGAVICTVAAVRELLAFGALWEFTLLPAPPLEAAASPFFAFLMLGFLAALMQFIREMLRRFMAGEVSVSYE